MKKIEAQSIAIERVKVILEYIRQIMSDEEKVYGNMNFNSRKIDGQNMITLDIYVPIKEFEKHINLGITTDHINVLFKELLTQIEKEIFPDDHLAVTRFYTLKSMMETFDGIDITNEIGSKIKINMSYINKDLKEEYNKTHEDFLAKYIEENSHKKI